MKCFWIIENFAKEPSFKELADSCKDLGYSLLEITDGYSHDILNKIDSPCVIFNGSINMVKHVKKYINTEYYPFSYCTFENYLCSKYYSHFGPYLFNDKYCLMSLKELARQKYDVWGQYGKDATIFLRPDSGDKPFRAGLVDITEVDQLHETNKDIEHELVLVSTPKNIQWEGRFVVSRKKEIIASSTYRFQKNIVSIPSVPKESTKFCHKLINSILYYPDSVFCYDICQDSDGECWLLELTSFSAAGLYSSDKKEIVKKVSELAIEDYTHRKHSSDTSKI